MPPTANRQTDLPGVHFEHATSRRDFLARAGAGFGSIALASLLAREADAATNSQMARGMAAREPHFAAGAKSVIWCFLDGGPSHIDLFDPKPELTRLAGKPLPDSFTRPVTAMGRTAFTPLLASQRKFAKHGQSGIWVSDWYPHLAKLVDEMAVIRSCYADGLNHVGSICQMNTGSVLGGRPSLGSWCLYGLGSEAEDLPGYVVLTDNADNPPGGTRNWSTGFMPAAYQGTKFRDDKLPILHLAPDELAGGLRQRQKLDFIQSLNRAHLKGREEDDRLDARIAAYELAFRMQAAAPSAIDLSDESAETLALYGVDEKGVGRNARNCILARRLVERGVRCVQLYMGSGSKWDAHSDVEGNHSARCRESDQPIAGLLVDLKQRGLLDSTLVVWAGEFGRTPMSESGNGRDHNPYGFTMWMAGGGVKPGVTYGATDEIGLYAIENKVHVNDLHATILHLLGLDHERLTLTHNGRAERLTGVAGRVVHEVLA
ncbi:MAG TPA: DUF1501 domain-containing protein [Pirellulales bacterium]|nr:DUF1501 domain-containing protein [Pirellulales bacterium]